MYECIMCVLIPFLSVSDCVVQRSGLVWWDPKPLRDIHFGAHYEPDRLTIRRRFMGWLGDPYRSCNEYQMAIWTQNCVISCEYLFLCIFLITIINRYMCFTCIISCDHPIYYISMFTCTTLWDIVNVYFCVIVHYCCLLFKLLLCLDDDYTC